MLLNVTSTFNKTLCPIKIVQIYSSFVYFSSPAFLQSNSAESVAMGLLRQFEGMQLPAASELDWLVPEHDAPQKVQHLQPQTRHSTCLNNII